MWRIAYLRQWVWNLYLGCFKGWTPRTPYLWEIPWFWLFARNYGKSWNLPYPYLNYNQFLTILILIRDKHIDCREMWQRKMTKQGSCIEFNPAIAARNYTKASFIYMVEPESISCRAPYLDNSIFQSSKMKLIKVIGGYHGQGHVFWTWWWPN